MRPNHRQPNEMRPIRFTRHFTKHAEGSVLAEFGDTRVICTASIDERVPGFLKNSGQGWITAEYSMLPRATADRTPRELNRGCASGRTQEIQRLIGRSLRSAINLKALGERTITIDCDVLQADGGTRTTAISGGFVALVDAIQKVIPYKGNLDQHPAIHAWIAAISVGIYQGTPILDLEYIEDKKAETDMNIVMTEAGHFIEIQGTAEGHPFSQEEFNQMLALAKQGIQQIITLQKEAFSN